ncbi:MAG: helix-turn-helix domain-containing protein, partial [Synergistaceae bacterium]|nr:helix-turn-helix domain-containing protein [Synergistaceae bacterium]
MIDIKLIRELRKEKGLTQAELGDLIGADGNLVSRWERGRSVPSY